MTTKTIIRVGFGEDMTGNATERYEIVAETTDGRYVIRHFSVIKDLYYKPFIVGSSLQLRNKEDITDIREIELKETV